MASEHRDYSSTPLARKLGIREGSRVLVVGAPQSFDLGALPEGVERLGRAGRRMDVVLLFVTKEAGLRRRLEKLAGGLDAAGRLWVAWPKRSSTVDTDLDFAFVQRTGLELGLVDNKSASVNEDFQGLQFVYRLRHRAERR